MYQTSILYLIRHALIILIVESFCKDVRQHSNKEN